MAGYVRMPVSCAQSKRFRPHPTPQPRGRRILMTSNERHEARYQRRKAERERRRIERSKAVGGLSRVFTFHSMFKAGKGCCNGVRWKNSTQRFELHLFSQTAKTRRLLFERKWAPGRYVSFLKTERGKVRPIHAPRIQDRQVHKTLTRGALLPLYTPDMIYNNGASLPGKGFDFSQRMLCEDLRRHFRKYGREGYIILMDFKKFFPSVPHAAIYARHDKILKHPAIKEIAKKLVDSMPGDVGLPLGVETSQMEMVALPSPVDNFIKCQLSLKGGGHYMDDYNMLVPPNLDANEVLEKVIAKAESMGLKVNRAKTHICPLTKSFKYCKAKYTLTESGKVVVNGNREGVHRARSKIKSLIGKYKRGELLFEDLRAGIQGSIAYYDKHNDHNRVLRLRRLVYAISGFKLDKHHNIIQEDNTQCDMWFSDDSAHGVFAVT